MKKLRQKEQKAKDLTDVDNRVRSTDTMDCTSGSTGTPTPRASSESDLYAQEASIDQDPQSSEPAGSPDPVTETNFILHVHTEDADQNMDHLKQMENCGGEPTVAQYLLSKPSRNFRNGFCSGQVPVAKFSISMKHGNHKDPKAATSANWHKIWTRKSKPDNEEEGSSDRVDGEHRDQLVIIDNSEVLIGSISVTLGQSNDCCQDSGSSCCSCYQEKLVTPDSSMNDVNCSGAKLRKPVACQYNFDYTTMRSDKRENTMDGHSAGTAGQISPDQSCFSSVGMDGASSEGCKDLLAPHRSANLSRPMLYSVKDAEAFLAQRWKEAIASDHVQLVLTPETKALDNFRNPKGNCTEAPMQSSNSMGGSILGRAENQMAVASSTELAFGASKPKFRPKPEKNFKLQYVPKQRNNALGE